MDTKYFCHSVRGTYIGEIFHRYVGNSVYQYCVLNVNQSVRGYFQCPRCVIFSTSQFRTCIKNLKICALKYTCISWESRKIPSCHLSSYYVLLMQNNVKFLNGKLCLNFVSKEYIIREKSDETFSRDYRNVSGNFLPNFIILPLEEYIIWKKTWKSFWNLNYSSVLYLFFKRRAYAVVYGKM